MTERVVITGLGIISCLGNDAGEVKNALFSGRSGISLRQDHIDADVAARGRQRFRHALRQSLSTLVQIGCEGFLDLTIGTAELLEKRQLPVTSARIDSERDFSHSPAISISVKGWLWPMLLSASGIPFRGQLSQHSLRSSSPVMGLQRERIRAKPTNPFPIRRVGFGRTRSQRPPQEKELLGLCK